MSTLARSHLQSSPRIGTARGVLRAPHPNAPTVSATGTGRGGSRPRQEPQKGDRSWKERHGRYGVRFPPCWRLAGAPPQAAGIRSDGSHRRWRPAGDKVPGRSSVRRHRRRRGLRLCFPRTTARRSRADHGSGDRSARLGNPSGFQSRPPPRAGHLHGLGHTRGLPNCLSRRALPGRPSLPDQRQGGAGGRQRTVDGRHPSGTLFAW